MHEMRPIAMDDSVAVAWCMRPAKTAERMEVLFEGERLGLINIVLDGGPDLAKLVENVGIVLFTRFHSFARWRLAGCSYH